MQRSQKALANMVNNVETIMVDIEGTTTSISFVKEVLFPYIRREIATHLDDTWNTHETRHDVSALKQQVREDVCTGVAGVLPLPSGDDHHALVPGLAACVLAMMDADRKVAALKTLQGHMWRRAYHTGAITAHVYEDVVGALQEWRDSGKHLVVYSSGSVQAQKLLFSHSCHGDLLHFFSEHFDTTVGSKVEVESYRRIVQSLGCPPEKVLFITDLAKEARAAEGAGLRVVLSVREGTAPLTPEDLAAFPIIHSFAQLRQQQQPHTPATTPMMDNTHHH